MEMVTKTVEVPKEWSELADAFVAVAKAVKAAKADGWNNAQDIPAVLLASFAPLTTAINGVDQLAPEFKENPAAALQAMLLAGSEVYAVLK